VVASVHALFAAANEVRRRARVVDLTYVALAACRAAMSAS
jgi:hypothetical protein